MKFGVITFPGSNCDQDIIYVLESIMDQQVERLWHKDPDLKGCDFIIVPGGFSYGDYLRCGSMASKSKIMHSVINFAKGGGKVIGICNGFQILVESGLLPGVLLRNKYLEFICKNVHVTINNKENSFFKDFEKDTVEFHIAHNEGNYFAPEDQLAMLEDNGQIALRYTEGSHPGPANPNGAAHDIAGIISENGRVMGMMPHPERAIGDGHHSADGRIFLQAALEGVAQ